MVLTLDAAWAPTMLTSGVTPVYLATLNFGPACYFNVNDYTLATVGDSATIVTDLGNHILISLGAGAPPPPPSTGNFYTGPDDETTAHNMAVAINAAFTTGGLYAVAQGTLVTVIAIPAGGGSPTSISFATSTAAAWSATIPALPASQQFVSGPRPLSGLVNAIDEVTIVANRMDVFTRQFTVGGAEIIFKDDGTMRDLLTRCRPKGRLVSLALGCAALFPSQYAPIGLYVVDDIIPEPGKIMMKLIEPTDHLGQAYVFGNFICMHPLDVILRVLELAQYPAVFYDASSLDSTSSTPPHDYSLISHWAVTHNNYLPNAQQQTGSATLNYGQPMIAKTVIADMVKLLGGRWGPDETGVASYTPYDATAATVRDLYRTDVGDFVVETMASNVTNRVNIGGASGGFFGGDTSVIFTDYWGAVQVSGQGAKSYIYSAEDQLTPQLYGIDGSPRLYDASVTSDWIGVSPMPLAASLPTSTTDLLIRDPTIAGFTGTRPLTAAVNTGLPTQRLEDSLNGGRTTTILITDGISYEIVIASAFAWLDTTDFGSGPPRHWTRIPIGPGFFNYVQSGTLASTPDGYGYFPQEAHFTVARGQLGSSVVNWPNPDANGNPVPFQLYDITIAVDIAQRTLARFASGCPIVRITTHLGNYDLQVGDFITVIDDIYVNFQHSSSDQQVIWEIIGKELKITEDTPSVELQLAWVRDDVTVQASAVSIAPIVSVVGVPSGPSPDDVVTDNSDIPVTQDSTGSTVTRS
jgi:hypothetical protein